MVNKIFGKIVDTVGSSLPLPKFRVSAWDDDWPDGDDFLGEDQTDADGNYQIPCMGNLYDEAFPGFPVNYPDIYITADIKNKNNQWVRLGRSQVFKNYNLARDLEVDLEVRLEAEILKEPDFQPDVHGFQFINSFKFRPEFLNIEFKEMGLGFCGGMSAAALNRFLKGAPMPTTTKIPVQGSELYEELKGRQIQSMPPQVLVKMYNFQTAPDQVSSFSKLSIGQLTRKEWPKLKAQLDNGIPTILILIRSKGLYGNPTNNHQVLAIGYRFDPPRKDLEIYVYDPNKKREVNTLSMNLALPDGKLGFKDSSRSRTRGFFINDAGPDASR